MATVTKDKAGVKARSKPTQGKRTSRPFVEQPATPLSDADRDIFLALLDSDDEPNEALRAAAAEFKRQFPGA